jgi:hypothetical protein
MAFLGHIFWHFPQKTHLLSSQRIFSFGTSEARKLLKHPDII